MKVPSISKIEKRNVLSLYQQDAGRAYASLSSTIYYRTPSYTKAAANEIHTLPL